MGVVVTFLVLWGVYFLVSKPQVTYFEQQTKISDNDHTKWSSEGKNIIVMYSDFQCPGCKSYEEVLSLVEQDKQITKDFTLSYKNFPLDSIHKNARKAAYTAEASAKQGKFWEMHDLLFENQTTWEGVDDPMELFTKYAEDLELDKDKFLQDVESDEVKEKVQNDYLSGVQSQVNSTPTFFVNGSKVNLNSIRSADDFKNMLLSLKKD